jgi:hypothetical protein
MSQETRSIEVIQCGHCGNNAPMEAVAEYSQLHTQYENGVGSRCWDEGDIYELLLCPACSSVILRSYYWHDGYMETSENTTFRYLYPASNKKPLGLPPEIQRAYDAAIKVKYIDVNAYAVLVGRVLEMICKDRNAAGKTLNDKLADLSVKGEVPSKLVKVAESLRHLRNIGAHAGLGELTKSEEPILSSLCSAILEYVYSALYLVQQAEDRLEKLKESNK